MKNWIGRWLIGVSVLHTLFAVAVFGEVLVSIVKQGIFNTAGKDAMTGVVVWFVLFGVILFICGLAIAELERTTRSPLPKYIGWSLFALGVLGVTLMPASGFWLIFPPAIAVLVRKASPEIIASET